MCQETGKKENGSTEDNSRIFPEAYLENQGTQQCQVFRPSNSEYEFVVGLQYIFAWKRGYLHQICALGLNAKGQKSCSLSFLPSFYFSRKWERVNFLSTQTSFLADLKQASIAFFLFFCGISKFITSVFSICLSGFEINSLYFNWSI